MDVDGKRFLEIAFALTADIEQDHLMSVLLKQVMAVSPCERGVLFLWRNNKLVCHEAMQAEGKHIRPWLDLMSIDAASNGRIIAADRLKSSDRFNDYAIQNEDLEMGVKTLSLLALPVKDISGKVIGVVRLSNARDNEANITPFSKDSSGLAMAVLRLGAVSLSNRKNIEAMRELLASLVRVISVAIDERTPFNANHTRNMAKYALQLITFLNEYNKRGLTDIYFDKNRTKQFMMGVWMHDIGKIVIPNGIMNKDTRLGIRLKEVVNRLSRIALLFEIEHLKGRLSKTDFISNTNEISDVAIFIDKINSATALTQADKQKLNYLAKKKYHEQNGDICPWFTEDELKCLSIEKGTLTEHERNIMQGHVIFTEKMLNEIEFSKEYEMVPIWAAAHHEYLDGTGYPKGLKGNDIPTEVRLLTILDIFDALTATDRPYKSPMALTVALDVLIDMARQGKIDAGLVDLFIKSECWANRLLTPQ